MQVVIHAGAAFTDQGLLLKSLRANANMLAEKGISFLGPKVFRQSFMAPLAGLHAAPLDPLQLAAMRDVVPDDPAARRVILSAPGFLGERNAIIQDGQFCPLAGQRVAYLDKVFAEHEVELCVALRNPGSFIPKVLMSLHESTRQEVLDTTDLSCLSWLTMIEDIRDLAPDVSVTLWSNEDTPLIWGDILRTLAGLPANTPMQSEFALLSSLVSDIGKREILALVRQDTASADDAIRDKLADIFDTHAKLDEIEETLDLPGWSEDIVAAFSEIYEQDMARLQTMPDIRVIRP